MERFFLLSILTTTVEMTVCFICLRYLLRKRGENWDISRRTLAIGATMCGLMSLWMLVINLSVVQEHITTPILNPGLCLIFLSLHVVMTLYPISVVRPDWLTRRRSFFMFLPIAVLGVLYLLFIGRWTALDTRSDIWKNAFRPDVLLRLTTLFLMVPYCLIVLHLPYNARESSASRFWIVNYCVGLVVLCAVHIVFMLTLAIPLIVLLPVLAAVFYILSTEYEVEDRLRPGKLAPVPVPLPQREDQPELDTLPEKSLWERICELMDIEQLWRDPNLTLTSMAHSCATNVTYLNHTIREHTQSGFKDLVNRKRVACIEAQLRENPDIDVQQAFFLAGYRSRTTAWRNFKDITGKSPAEYRDSLKANVPEA